MSVAQPNILLAFTDASGSSITNDGSLGTAWSVGHGAETTDWIRHSTSGLYNGYLESLTQNGSGQTWIQPAGTAPSGALEAINFLMAFRITSFSSLAYLLSPNGSSNGDAQAWASAPAGSGDFDLNARFLNNGGAAINMTAVLALTFGTDYVLSGSLDPSTATATQARFKLGAASVDAPATANWNTFGLNASWPWGMRQNGFDNYFGWKGRNHAFVYQRGGTFWSSSDLGSINSNPTTFITGWPGGGGGGGATRGMPFGHQGTAFNGGRVFTGILNRSRSWLPQLNSCSA